MHEGRDAQDSGGERARRHDAGGRPGEEGAGVFGSGERLHSKGVGRLRAAPAQPQSELQRRTLGKQVRGWGIALTAKQKTVLTVLQSSGDDKIRATAELRNLSTAGDRAATIKRE